MYWRKEESRRNCTAGGVKRGLTSCIGSYRYLYCTVAADCHNIIQAYFEARGNAGSAVIALVMPSSRSRHPFVMLTLPLPLGFASIRHTMCNFL